MVPYIKEHEKSSINNVTKQIESNENQSVSEIEKKLDSLTLVINKLSDNQM